MNKDSIIHLISDIFYISCLIEKRIDQILLNTFPTNSARFFLRAQKKICKYSREILFYYFTFYDSAQSQATTLFQFIYYFLRSELAAHIRFAEGASIDRTPASFVMALEKLVDSLGILENSVFILRPQWHYNFKIFEIRDYYEESLTNYLTDEQVKDIFSEFTDKKIYVISFPGFQRDNLQIQTAIGHELGHPIARKYIDIEEKNYKFEIEQEVVASFQKELVNLNVDERDEKKAGYIDRIVSLRNGFLEELISDLISSYLFNLCSIFETETYLWSSSNLDDPDLDLENPHPAWRTRLRVMFNDLIERDLFILKNDEYKKLTPETFSEIIVDLIKEKVKKYSAIIDDNTDINNLKSNHISEIAYKSCEKTLPAVIEWLKKEYSAYSFDSNFIDIIKCVGRLKEGIPPNATNEKSLQHPKIQNIQNILISGRLYKEAFLEPVTAIDRNLFIEKLDTLNKLMLKAIELSQIHKAFQSYKNP